MLRRALQDVTGGFYVDIGAFEPDMHSVTKHFYDAGWSGINVEPNPPIFARLARERPRDINLNCVVGGECGRIGFSLVGETGLSAVDPPDLSVVAPCETVRALDVEMMTVDAILARYAPNRVVDFLKIDVEGYETAVLRGAKLEANRPRIVVVEATRMMSQEPAWAEWEPILLDTGYAFAWFDGLNRFYIRDEDAARHSCFLLPPCCFDNFRLEEAGAASRVVEMSARLQYQAQELERQRALLEATSSLS